LTGFCFGGVIGIFPALPMDSFGVKNNGANFGIMFSGFAVASFAGCPLWLRILKPLTMATTAWLSSLPQD
jgi:predicted MFS family arabinose efflux permease